MNIQVIEDEKLNEIILKIDTIQKMLSQMESGQAVFKGMAYSKGSQCLPKCNNPKYAKLQG